MGGRKTRSGALIGAFIVVMLPSLLSDFILFRTIATAAAVIGVVVSGFLLATRRRTLRQIAVPLVATVGMALFSYKLQNITDWRLTIFGLMTLFVVYYLQDGIVGFARTLIGKPSDAVRHIKHGTIVASGGGARAGRGGRAAAGARRAGGGI